MVIPVKKTLPVHVTPNRYQKTPQSRWNPVIPPYLTYLWDLLERNGTVRSNNRQNPVNVVLWWIHNHSTPNNLRFDVGSFCRVRDQITSTLGARGQRVISHYLAQASQAYVTSVLCKRVGVALQVTVETLCKRNKILRSVKAKYHYFYFFFYKVNKGDLPLMY